MVKRIVLVIIALLIVVSLLLEAFGQQDKKKAADFVTSMKAARVIELNFVWDRNSPLLGLEGVDHRCVIISLKLTIDSDIGP